MLDLCIYLFKSGILKHAVFSETCENLQTYYACLCFRLKKVIQWRNKRQTY